MSEIAVAWAKAQAVSGKDGAGQDANAKQVLCYVASWADAAGYVWASVPVLAFEMAKSERTVQRGLGRLKAAGLLLDTGRTQLHLGRLYPVYRMPIEDGPANTLHALKAVREASREAARVASKEAARGDAHVTPSEGAGCHPCHPTPDADVTPRGDTHVTQIGKEDSQGKHSAGARAGDDDDDFEAALSAWSAKAPERASRPRAWAAWAAVMARSAMTGGRLRAAVERAVARDPDFGRGKAMNLDRWLGEDRWEPWLLELETGQRVGPAAGAATLWDGPPEVRAAVARRLGDGAACSLIDPARWDGERRAVMTRTRYAADRLGRDMRAELAGLDVSVEFGGGDGTA